MSLNTVRTKIKGVIESVSGMGTVYDYARYVKDWGTYKTLFEKSGKINTWDIKRIDVSSDPFGGSGGRENRIHSFVLRGFYAVSDELASDKTFQDLVDLVIDAFRNKPTLEGTSNVTIIQFPITGNISEQMFGGVLCHVAQINLAVGERNLF